MVTICRFSFLYCMSFWIQTLETQEQKVKYRNGSKFCKSSIVLLHTFLLTQAPSELSEEGESRCKAKEGLLQVILQILYFGDIWYIDMT